MINETQELRQKRKELKQKLDETKSEAFNKGLSATIKSIFAVAPTLACGIAGCYLGESLQEKIGYTGLLLVFSAPINFLVLGLNILGDYPCGGPYYHPISHDLYDRKIAKNNVWKIREELRNLGGEIR